MEMSNTIISHRLGTKRIKQVLKRPLIRRTRENQLRIRSRRHNIQRISSRSLLRKLDRDLVITDQDLRIIGFESSGANDEFSATSGANPDVVVLVVPVFRGDELAADEEGGTVGPVGLGLVGDDVPDAAGPVVEEHGHADGGPLGEPLDHVSWKLPC